MADTTELIKDINNIENKLKNSIGNIISEFEVPIDFCLNDISIDFMPVQELGRMTKNYVLKDVKLSVAWEPYDYEI